VAGPAAATAGPRPLPGIEIDDAIEIAEKINVKIPGQSFLALTDRQAS
jgi:hypothetical protein